MDYDFNRRAFRSVFDTPGIDPLATIYCACILLELSLKQHLNLCSTAGNGGHDLPQLLQRTAISNPRIRGLIASLSPQLSSSLSKLFSQSKKGTARNIPANSYPHIRYLRHSSDWPSQSSSDQDLCQVLALLKRIMHLLKYTAGVSL